MKRHTLLFRCVAIGVTLALLSALLTTATAYALMARTIRSQEEKSRHISVSAAAQRVNEVLDGMISFVNSSANDASFKLLCADEFANEYQYVRYCANYKKAMESALTRLEGVRSLSVLLPSGRAVSLFVEASAQSFREGEAVFPEGLTLRGEGPSLTEYEGRLYASVPYQAAFDDSASVCFWFALNTEQLSSFSNGLFHMLLCDGQSPERPLDALSFANAADCEQSLELADWSLRCTFDAAPTIPHINPALFAAVLAAHLAVCGVGLYLLISRRLRPLQELERVISSQTEPEPVPIKGERHRLSFGRTLLLGLTGVVCCSALVFSMVSYLTNYAELERCVRDVFEESSALVCDNVERQTQRYREQLRRASILPQVQEALATGEADNPTEALSQMDDDRRMLRNVTLFSMRDQLVFSTAYVLNYLSDARMERAVLQARTGYGECVWLYSPDASGGAGELRVGMLVIGSHSEQNGLGEKLGTIWMDFGDDHLRALFTDLVAANGAYAVSDADGSVLFSSADFDADRADALSILRTIEAGGWSVRIVIPHTQLSAELKTFWRYALVILALMFVLLMLICTALERSLLHSMRNLTKGMRRATADGEGRYVAKRHPDEIDSIGLQYNQMMERLSASVHANLESERKARQFEINMLQAQINPHFLYNTLRTVQVLIAQKNPASVTVIDKLIVLFRSSASIGSKSVTLAEECKQIRAYLDIQAFRFGGRFRVELRVPKTLLQRQVLHFTLQPIVENVFQHAFDSIETDGVIVIEARLEPNALVVSVRDNGSGMTEEEQERWSQKAATAEYDSHIGMLNVHQRIRLAYGEPYGLTLHNAPDGGLMAELRFPAEAPENAEE